MNLMVLLEMAADVLDDRVAFTNGDEAISYRQLFLAAGEAAAEATPSTAASSRSGIACR